MNDFDYSDLRFLFEKAVDWDGIREARGGGEDFREEYLMTLDNGASFSQKEVAPGAEATDNQECRLEQGENGHPNSVHLPDEILSSIEGLKEIGAFCGLTLPEEVGGLDFPMTVFFGLGELFSMGDSSLGLTPMLQEGVAQVLIEFADEKIVADYLPKLLSGEKICSMGLTEPGAGSDLANMKTRAVSFNGSTHERTPRIQELEALGQVYLLNGSKIFITNGFGDVLALAQTEEGISMFLVAAEDKEVPRIEKKLGIRGSATCEILFDNSPGVLIGELGRGLVPNMLKLMHIARLGVSCQGLGIGQKAHIMATNYATNDRVQFGVPISEHPPVRQILFNNELNLQASRALTYLATNYFDLKEATCTRMQNLDPEDPALPALRKKLAHYTRVSDLLIPLAKYDTAELCNKIAYSSLQVFGGYGFTREYPVERLYRDARITSIYEGTSQIQIREVFNESYYVDKLGLLNQFKTGDRERFVETDKNRLLIDLFLNELQDQITSMNGDRSPVTELLHGIEEMRGCLKVSRQELFLQEQMRSKEDSRRYHALFHQDYVDLLAHILKSYLLTRQAVLSPPKERVARAYVDRALLEARHLQNKITSGIDDLIKDSYDVVMGT